MAEGNGELVEEMTNPKMGEGAGDGERTEDYTKLLEYGLDKKVSGCCLTSCFSNMYNATGCVNFETVTSDFEKH